MSYINQLTRFDEAAPNIAFKIHTYLIENPKVAAAMSTKFNNDPNFIAFNNPEIKSKVQTKYEEQLDTQRGVSYFKKKIADDTRFKFSTDAKAEAIAQHIFQLPHKTNNASEAVREFHTIAINNYLDAHPDVKIKIQLNYNHKPFVSEFLGEITFTPLGPTELKDTTTFHSFSASTEPDSDAANSTITNSENLEPEAKDTTANHSPVDNESPIVNLEGEYAYFETNQEVKDNHYGFSVDVLSTDQDIDDLVNKLVQKPDLAEEDFKTNSSQEPNRGSMYVPMPNQEANPSVVANSPPPAEIQANAAEAQPQRRGPKMPAYIAKTWGKPVDLPLPKPTTIQSKEPAPVVTAPLPEPTTISKTSPAIFSKEWLNQKWEAASTLIEKAWNAVKETMDKAWDMVKETVTNSSATPSSSTSQESPAQASQSSVARTTVALANGNRQTAIESLQETKDSSEQSAHKYLNNGALVSDKPSPSTTARPSSPPTSAPANNVSENSTPSLLESSSISKGP